MQEIKVVEKGMTLEIKDKEGNVFTNIYAGAGWDMVNEAVDLDLVGACLVDGKLTSQTRLVYFGDKEEPGVQLSEDNQTGEGDGDDENMVIDLNKVEADVNSIAIGVVAYSGIDLAKAKNFLFRICNGTKESDPQVFEVKADDAKDGETVLHAINLIRGANGWTIENVSKYYATGNGRAAVEGFAKLFM